MCCQNHEQPTTSFAYKKEIHTKACTQIFNHLPHDILIFQVFFSYPVNLFQLRLCSRKLYNYLQLNLILPSYKHWLWLKWKNLEQLKVSIFSVSFLKGSHIMQKPLKTIVFITFLWWGEIFIQKSQSRSNFYPASLGWCWCER